MAAQKHRLQFTDANGKKAANAGFQGKLLTDAEKAKNRREQLRFGKKETVVPADPSSTKSVPRKGVAFHDTLSAKALRAAADSITDHEDENVGTQALQEGVSLSGGTAREVHAHRYSRKIKQAENAVKLEQKTDKANIERQYRDTVSETGTGRSNPVSRWRQKQKIRKEYYAAKNAAQNTANTARTASTVVDRTKEVLEGIRTAVTSSTGIRTVFAIAMAFLLITAPFQSCSMITGGVLTTVTATSWPADDIQITKADAYYTKLEAQMQRKINTVESRHTGCEEYYYNLSEIGHDSTMLISYLSAKYQDFTFNQVRSELDAIFTAQYQYSEEIRTETRDTDCGGWRVHWPCGDKRLLQLSHLLRNLVWRPYRIRRIPQSKPHHCRRCQESPAPHGYGNHYEWYALQGRGYRQFCTVWGGF